MLTSNVPGGVSSVAPQPHAPRPDPEVPALPARARRRQFTASYKLRILHEADHTAIGHLGALLPPGRVVLVASDQLAPQRRGRPATSSDARELAQLREENTKLARRLAAAETVIEVQKKLHRCWG